jgi:hypothetical protein
MKFKKDLKYVKKLLSTDNFKLDFYAYNRIRVYKKNNASIFDDFVVVITPSIYDNGNGIDDVLDIYRGFGANITYVDNEFEKNHYLKCSYDFETLEKFSGKVKQYTI